MPEPRRGLTAEERLAALRRDQARLRRERLQREVAGPRWQRMVQIIPVLFRHEGELVVRRLRAEPSTVIEALREEGVFALNTAMRLAHGFGFLTGEDVHVYLTSAEPLDRLAEIGLIDERPDPDTVLLRPWPGAPRLFASVVAELPAWRKVKGGYRAVTGDRLRRELIGAVGPRADLFALLERAEGV